MTELLRLATALRQGEETVEQIHGVLHWAGFRGFTTGCLAYFRLLSEISPELNALAALYPGLQTAVDRLNYVGTLSARLSIQRIREPVLQDHLMGFSTQTPFEWIQCPEQPTWPLPELPPLPMILAPHQKNGCSKTMFAMAHLLQVIWEPCEYKLGRNSNALSLLTNFKSPLPYRFLWPDMESMNIQKDEETYDIKKAQIDARNKLKILDVSDLDPDTFADPVRILNAIKADLNKRAKAAGETYFSIDTPLQNESRKYKHLKELIECTTLDEKCTPSFALDGRGAKNEEEPLPEDASEGEEQSEDIEETEEPEWEWGDGESLNLSDRQLTCDFPNSLTPQAFKTIRRLLNNEPEIIRGKAKAIAWIDQWTAHMLRVALPTGQLLDDAAATRIISEELVSTHLKNSKLNNSRYDTGIVIRHSVEPTEKSYKYFWYPANTDLSDSPPLEVLETSDWPWYCTDFTVAEQLPLPADLLIPFIKERTARAVDRPQPSSRLAIKHALARELFSYNANRASIRHACGSGSEKINTDPDDDALDEKLQEIGNLNSLHHYLHPNCSAIVDAYKIAQLRLWGRDSRNAMKLEFVGAGKSACMWINADRFSRIVANAKYQIETSEEKDIKILHNLFVKYVALMLLFCTGHRRAEALFYFYFSISLEEKVAFISEKQIVGSEARFVPLPQTATNQVSNYLQHLMTVIDALSRTSDPLAAKVLKASGLSRSQVKANFEIGPFLFLFENNDLVPVGTENLAQWIDQIETQIGPSIQDVSKISAYELRRNYATFLANRQVSGAEIEFLLGHNSYLHTWGPASYKAPKDRLEVLGKHIEEYLHLNGLTALRPTWITYKSDKHEFEVPLFALSNIDYEGRKADSDSAAERARCAILRVVDPEALEDKGISVIDDDLLREIRHEIAIELENDVSAKEKVLDQLSLLISQWRRMGKAKSSAALVNLRHKRAGPIDIAFGRHLTIANAVQKELPRSIEFYLDDVNISSIERLTVVAVMFVMTEAVLTLQDVIGLIDALQTENVRSFVNDTAKQLRIRATIETRTAIYERTCDLTDKGALAVAGYLLNRQTTEVYSWKQIALHVEKFLKRLCKNMELLTFAQLITIHQSYWVLKLPGSIYGCCIGQSDSSSESAHTTQVLLGGSPVYENAVSRIRTPIAYTRDKGVDLAVDEMKLLFKTARGVLENHEQGKRMQRGKLSQLFEAQMPQAISDLSSQQSIVEIWIEFLKHLLYVGGPRQKKYALGSMSGYQSRILRQVLTVGWDQELEDLDADGYDEFYTAVLSLVEKKWKSSANTVLKIFHNFLRTHLHAPRCKKFPTGNRPKRRARNIIYSSQTLKNAVGMCNSVGGRHTRNARAAANLLRFNANWALRPMEGFGLRLNDYKVLDQLGIQCRRNTTRNIKTSKGVRRVMVGLSSPSYQNSIQNIYRASHQYGRSRPNLIPFFADPDNDSRLMDWRSIRFEASSALKIASNNGAAVLYSLRHTWGTIGLLQLIAPSPASPIAKAMAASLPQLSLDSLHSAKPGPAIYPNFIDRLAMWLGHASVDTLLTTYGHCIWLLSSEFAFKNAQREPFTQVQISLLLNVSRSKVTRAILSAGSDKEKALQVHHAVCRLIEKCCPNLLSEGAMKLPPGGALTTPVSAEIVTIATVEHLLELRHFENHDINELANSLTLATGITLSDATRLVDAYIDVRDETQFRDFEPRDLQSSLESRTGVQPKQIQRRRFLEKINEKCNSSPDFRKATSNFSSQWCRKVRKDNPRLVLSTTTQVENAIDWMQALGYPSQYIDIAYFGDRQAELRGVKLSQVFKSMDKNKKPDHVDEYGLSASEFGNLPAGRNFQRIMFALAIYDRADFFEQMT